MLSLLLILFCSIFFTGIILRTKSLTSGRKGPGIMQPVKDVVRLFKKGTIYSETTSIIFRIAPVITFSSVLMACLVIPFGSFKGVVSFHGGLAGVPANKALLKSKILVCHGGADKFVPQKDVEAFKHQMDSIGADYKFIVYPNATHAFTNPDATAIGKKFNMPIEYNPQADKDSWNDMKMFFRKIFTK